MKRLVLAGLFLVFLAASALAYIGNINSYKFHKDACYWVSRMNESNKVYIRTREQAINDGFVPCKVCKP